MRPPHSAQKNLVPFSSSSSSSSFQFRRLPMNKRWKGKSENKCGRAQRLPQCLHASHRKLLQTLFFIRNHFQRFFFLPDRIYQMFSRHFTRTKNPKRREKYGLWLDRHQFNDRRRWRRADYYESLLLFPFNDAFAFQILDFGRMRKLQKWKMK